MNWRALKGGILSINGATMIRAARCGVSDALDRGRQALAVIDPFGEPDADVSGIPEIELRQIVPDAGEVLVDGQFATVDGALAPFELIPLLVIVKHFNPRAVLEIGTYFGSTTRNLALNLPEARIHTVDLPPDFASGKSEAKAVSAKDAQELQKDDFHLISGRRLGAAFAQKPEAARIVQHLGDTAAYDFSVITDPITFFFVDGSHTRDYARSDTLRCMEMAKSPSVMLWHDVNPSHSDVVQWMMEMRNAGLDVQRIRGTSLCYLTFSPGDASIARLKAR
jgi:hypothetical protein